MLAYVKGFLVLFVILTLLLYLPPGKSYQKYIRFFTELILTIGLLSPVLSVVFDSEEFLALIAYEEFAGNLSEVSKDMQRVEYMHKDYYRKEYEKAIGEDVKLMAEPVAEKYGFTVREAAVHMTKEYAIDEITLWIVNQGEERIMIDEITLSDGGNRTELGTVYESIAQEVANYYQVEFQAVRIQHTSGD